MRQPYAERALADALNKDAPSRRVGLKPGDVKLVNHLKETEVAPSPLSICGVKRSYAPGFVIGSPMWKLESRARLAGTRICARGSPVKGIKSIAGSKTPNRRHSELVSDIAS